MNDPCRLYWTLNKWNPLYCSIINPITCKYSSLSLKNKFTAKWQEEQRRGRRLDGKPNWISFNFYNLFLSLRFVTWHDEHEIQSTLCCVDNDSKFFGKLWNPRPYSNNAYAEFRVPIVGSNCDDQSVVARMTTSPRSTCIGCNIICILAQISKPYRRNSSRQTNQYSMLCATECFLLSSPLLFCSLFTIESEEVKSKMLRYAFRWSCHHSI